MTSTTRQSYASDQWHEITPGDNRTQFSHLGGTGRVVYTEAPAEPATPYTESIPVNAESKRQDQI